MLNNEDSQRQIISEVRYSYYLEQSFTCGSRQRLHKMIELSQSAVNFDCSYGSCFISVDS